MLRSAIWSVAEAAAATPDAGACALAAIDAATGTGGVGVVVANGNAGTGISEPGAGASEMGGRAAVCSSFFSSGLDAPIVPGGICNALSLTLVAAGCEVSVAVTQGEDGAVVSAPNTYPDNNNEAQHNAVLQCFAIMAVPS